MKKCSRTVNARELDILFENAALEDTRHSSVLRLGEILRNIGQVGISAILMKEKQRSRPFSALNFDDVTRQDAILSLFAYIPQAQNRTAASFLLGGYVTPADLTLLSKLANNSSQSISGEAKSLISFIQRKNKS